MKLREYLKEYGIRKTWFAKKIGINPTSLSDALGGRKKIPEKYWKKIVRLTQKKVKIEDLFNDSYPD
ncbi:MAG TPA: XRE family transcriptional regulator [Candidatus Aminicenantes bacterium]|nr:XRE family transcriptional regulator [Candidatus Aminicenantes bacterium]